MAHPKIRTGQVQVTLSEEEFRERARAFYPPPDSFDAARRREAAIDQQWQIYTSSQKWREEVSLGPDFKNPDFRFGKEWVEAYDRLGRAKRLHHEPASPTRFLLINASPRNDQTCPGEMSKSHRLCLDARDVLGRAGQVEVLDLSRLTAEYGKRIHPCKSCVATAMPLCHWPCSCYPNSALGQVQDWMNEIYEMWMRAHGVMIVSPVHWYSPTSVLKLMMDRMVCADGGNPDPSTTEGKDPEAAKKLELEGWPYPKHLAGRRYSVITHGDAEGALQVRQAIEGWLTDLGLESAGPEGSLDRYIGYYEPYATSHEALDRAKAIHEEVKRAARILVEATLAYRARLEPPNEDRPGLRRSEWSSGSESTGASGAVRPK